VQRDRHLPPGQAAAARLEAAGVAVVDAPVSGGVTWAGQGDLLIFVGGTAEVVAQVQLLLDALAQSAPVVGPSAIQGLRRVAVAVAQRRIVLVLARWANYCKTLP
jgi:6-phosphogluconate dehydrogenase (decarboxylating)